MTEYFAPIAEEINATVSFPVDVECYEYPDVMFSVVFEKHPNQSMIEQCVSALHSFMETYNKKHFIRPIHYVCALDALVPTDNPFSICVHIDFGFSNPKAIVGAVRAVADTNLPIYRIVVGCEPF